LPEYLLQKFEKQARSMGMALTAALKEMIAFINRGIMWTVGLMLQSVWSKVIKKIQLDMIGLLKRIVDLVN